MASAVLDPKLTIALVLAVTLVLFVWGRWRHDGVALIALLAAVVSGAVEVDGRRSHCSQAC